MTNDPRALSNLSVADYDAIELAVMETARGRWFLKEYAARNRNADTNVLMNAISRLEGAVSGEGAMEQIDRVRFDLVEMAKSISGLKAELESHDQNGEDHGQFGAATSALDQIVQTTEQATSNILSAAEQVQEIAWSLREQQFDERVCDKLDKLATEIYTACTFQDLTAQRTQKVVRTLRFLEGRINALIDAWAGKEGSGAAAPESHHRSADVSAMQLPPHDLSQSDVDIVIVDDPFTRPADQQSTAMPSNVMAALSMAEAVNDVDEVIMDLAPAVVELPQHDADELTFAPLPEVGPEVGQEVGDDQMVCDGEPMIIDDLDTLEVDFIATDADVAEYTAPKALMTPPAIPLAAPVQSGSLAQIDAMPTQAKAMIFG